MTRIIGHRGGRNVWPENSLTGFRNLLALPVEAVEFDVHPTDAGELVVIHDPTLDRTTDATGPVRALTPEARATVRLSGTEEGIPLLDEVLAVLAPSSLDLHVELKADPGGVPYDGLPARTAEALARHGLKERSFLTSFNFEVLAECRRVAPNIRRLCSMNRKSADRLGLGASLDLASERADVLAVQNDLLDAEWDRITAAWPLDRLGAWVPNTEDELRYWLSRGLHQITTDRPDLALGVREGLTPAVPAPVSR